MGATIGTIFGAVLASQALFSFLQFIITRRDTKKSFDDKLKDIKNGMTLLEKNVLRSQLLLLILLRPEEQQEILTIAEHYFSPVDKGGLDGDWYMTSIFNHWILEQDIAKPEWFNNDK